MVYFMLYLDGDRQFYFYFIGVPIKYAPSPLLNSSHARPPPMQSFVFFSGEVDTATAIGSHLQLRL